MKPRSAILIYNPRAGSANHLAALQQVAEWWRVRGWDVSVKPTEWAGHARLLAQTAAAEGVGVVLAAGGDGTFNEVANGLAGSPTILAPLPSGTGNSLAKEFGMQRPSLLRSRVLLKSADSLFNGRVQTIDLIACDDGRYAMQWVGADVAAYVVENIEPRTKFQKRFGAIGYFIQASRHIVAAPRWLSRVEIDEEVYEGDFGVLSVSNSQRFVGGEIVLHPQAQWDDGRLEVVLFDGRSLTSLYRVLLQARFGHHSENPRVTLLSGRCVTLRTTPQMPYHRDGEPAGKTPVSCELRQGMLRMLVPDSAPANLFSQPGITLQMALEEA